MIWNARDALDHLSIVVPSITDYFGISEPFPKIRVVLVPDRNEFDRLVRDLLQVEIEVPSYPARIAQAQKTDMVLLSPSAYSANSTFVFVPAHFHRLLVHEFIHMVEESLSPDIESVSAWWSEGLAVYLSGQWLFEDDFRKAALDGVDENIIPTILQIEIDRKLAYDWGWALVKFFENVYGKNMILGIVRECADGKVFSIIGANLGIIEPHWKAWLQIKGSLTSPHPGTKYDHWN